MKTLFSFTVVTALVVWSIGTIFSAFYVPYAFMFNHEWFVDNSAIVAFSGLNIAVCFWFGYFMDKHQEFTIKLVAPAVIFVIELIARKKLTEEQKQFAINNAIAKNTK